MFEFIVPYLIATLATIVVLLIAVVVYRQSRVSADVYRERAQRLPEACQYEDLTARVAESKQQLDELRSELIGAQNLIQQKQVAETWLNDNRQELLKVEAEREQQERSRAQLGDLRRLEETAQARYSDLAQRVELADLRLKAIQQESESLKKLTDQARTRLQTVTEQLSTAEQRKRAAESELSGLETQIQARRNELEEMKQHHARIMKALHEEVEDTKRARDEARSELRETEGERQGLYDEISELKDSHASLSARIEGLKAQEVAMQEQLADLRTDWKRMQIRTGADEVSHERRTAELWEPVFPASEYQVRRRDEMESLSDTSDYLQALGLQFPERVLWAFHTSLKVADVSPLVVLAGISGTGKSELPRRYAEAMGMHFLNVAVQPRWDSPQDMFGFYNYLEERYRATELGRALIQMDPWHAKDKRGWHPPEEWNRNSLCNQMLVVLLDEMNLARIEYYFSEFLSRMEIRRGINRDDATDRQKAEIGLEIGSVGGRDPVMRLFVDTNVLFVGTMNEDETTQALSDKVVDRANVLRFGRPHNLARQAANGSPLASHARLAYDSFCDWRRNESDLSQEVSYQIDGWIGRLNSALTKIHRPFAHRTHLAMKTYVANYPVGDDNHIRQAMADQIEQKVLPKFRGVDPSQAGEALDMLLDVVRDTGDQALSDAIEESRRDDQFVWMGIDRMDEQISQV